LADDLKRFLEDRPIRARRPTLVQRAAKWSRRHKPVVAAAVVLLVMATFGFAASTLLIAQEKARTEAALGRSQESERRARESEAKERNLAKEAQRLKRQAEKNLERARDNLEQALDAAGQLVTCLEDDRFFVAPEMQEVRQTALKEALKLFEAFLDEHGMDPEVRYQTARAYVKIAVIQRTLGRFAQSESASTQAISLLERLLEESPSEGQYRVALADAYTDFGLMLNAHAFRHADSVGPLRRAVGLYENLIADPPNDVAEQSDAAQFRCQMIWCKAGLIHALHIARQFQEAERLSRQQTAEAERLAADFPAQPIVRLRLGNAWQGRGFRLTDMHRFEEASEAFLRALEVQEQLVADFPKDHGYRHMLAAIYYQFGNLLGCQGKLHEAEDRLRKGIALFEELSDERPTSQMLNVRLRDSYHGLAVILNRMQRFDEVVQAYRRARDAMSRSVALAPEDPIHAERLAESSNLLGSYLKRRGQHEKALEAYRHEQGVYEKLSQDFPEESRYQEKVIQGKIKLADMLETEQLLGKPEDKKDGTGSEKEAPVAKPH
jgi:tetratricopeptide (TPR) repeat protein